MGHRAASDAWMQTVVLVRSTYPEVRSSIFLFGLTPCMWCPRQDPLQTHPITTQTVASYESAGLMFGDVGEAGKCIAGTEITMFAG